MAGLLLFFKTIYCFFKISITRKIESVFIMRNVTKLNLENNIKFQSTKIIFLVFSKTLLNSCF